MSLEWMPEPKERLFFITASGNGPVHVHYVTESTAVHVGKDGRINVELYLKPDGSPALSLEEQLAVSVLRKDVVASLALADDVREKFVEPEGFVSREDLKKIVVGLKDEVERSDKEDSRLRDVLDKQRKLLIGKIEELQADKRRLEQELLELRHVGRSDVWPNVRERYLRPHDPPR